MAKRFPVQIGNWQVVNGEYSKEGLLTTIRNAVDRALSNSCRPGILLSGGVDSSLLALLAKEKCPNIPCFTIGDSPQHPDVVAAMHLAAEFDLDLRVYLPNKGVIKEATKRVQTKNDGDNAVLLALEFASKFVTDIIAADGIDEQMGGYWWHVHRNDQFPKAEQAFEYFWGQLEGKHLKPMFNSAELVGVNVHWVYLDPEVVDYIARIPLDVRVHGGIGKAYWKETAKQVGVPEWVIQRPKRGFLHALC